MSTISLSSNGIKLLSQVLHSTLKSIGRTSKLAAKREMLSKRLGFNDWNSACAILPEHLDCTTHTSIALLELPSAAPVFLMTTGNDAPWRLPEEVRDHLFNQSLNPKDFIVSHSSRPDSIVGVKPKYWFFDVARGPDDVIKHKVKISPHVPDYSFEDLNPTVTILSNKKGHKVCTVTTWHITLSATSNTALNFRGAVSRPLYNTFIESITDCTHELREAYCLVNSRQAGSAYAIVKCNERGSELEVVEHLPFVENGQFMEDDQAWKKVAPYNKALGLSLLDVADITIACFSEDSEV